MIAPGQIHVAPDRPSHPGWTVRVVKASAQQVRVLVLAGPSKSKGKHFTLRRASFERGFKPA